MNGKKLQLKAYLCLTNTLAGPGQLSHNILNLKHLASDFTSITVNARKTDGWLDGLCSYRWCVWECSLMGGGRPSACWCDTLLVIVCSFNAFVSYCSSSINSSELTVTVSCFLCWAVSARLYARLVFSGPEIFFYRFFSSRVLTFGERRYLNCIVFLVKHQRTTKTMTTNIRHLTPVQEDSSTFRWYGRCSATHLAIVEIHRAEVYLNDSIFCLFDSSPWFFFSRSLKIFCLSRQNCWSRQIVRSLCVHKKLYAFQSSAGAFLCVSEGCRFCVGKFLWFSNVTLIGFVWIESKIFFRYTTIITFASIAHISYLACRNFFSVFVHSKYTITIGHKIHYAHLHIANTHKGNCWTKKKNQKEYAAPTQCSCARCVSCVCRSICIFGIAAVPLVNGYRCKSIERTHTTNQETRN